MNDAVDNPAIHVLRQKLSRHGIAASRLVMLGGLAQSIMTQQNDEISTMRSAVGGDVPTQDGSTSVLAHPSSSSHARLGRRRPPPTNRNNLPMTKLGTSVGLLALILSLSARAQTVEIMTLDQVGAEKVLQAAKQNAERRNAPSAIAVVDPAGDLLAFQRMDHVRPASADLAIEKARTAARLRRPTEEVEDNINRGRTAFVTAGIAALRGGVPISVNGQVVGAVGVAGLSKETDTGIANTAAAALGQPPTTVPRK
jgi:glc operon protein GlcG